MGSLFLDFCPSVSSLPPHDNEVAIIDPSHEFPSSSAPSYRPQSATSVEGRKKIEESRPNDSSKDSLEDDLNHNIYGDNDDEIFANQRHIRKSSISSTTTVQSNPDILSALSQLQRPIMSTLEIDTRVEQIGVKAESGNLGRRQSAPAHRGDDRPDSNNSRGKSNGKHGDKDSNLATDKERVKGNLSPNNRNKNNVPVEGGADASTAKKQQPSWSSSSQVKRRDEVPTTEKRKFKADDIKKSAENFDSEYNKGHLDPFQGKQDFELRAHELMMQKIMQNKEVEEGSIKQLLGLGNFQAQLLRGKAGGTNMRKRLEDEIDHQRAAEKAIAGPRGRAASASIANRNGSYSLGKANRPHSALDAYGNISELQPYAQQQLDHETLQQHDQDQQLKREQEMIRAEERALFDQDMNPTKEAMEKKEVMSEKEQRSAMQGVEDRVREKTLVRGTSASVIMQSKPRRAMSSFDGIPTVSSVKVRTALASVSSGAEPAAEDGKVVAVKRLSEKEKGKLIRHSSERLKKGAGQVSFKGALPSSEKGPTEKSSVVATIEMPEAPQILLCSEGSPVPQKSIQAQENQRKYEFWRKVVQIVTIRTLLSCRLQQLMAEDKEREKLKLINAANIIGIFYKMRLRRRMDRLMAIMMKKHTNLRRPFKLLVSHDNALLSSSMPC